MGSNEMRNNTYIGKMLIPKLYGHDYEKIGNTISIPKTNSVIYVITPYNNYVQCRGHNADLIIHDDAKHARVF